MLSLILADLFFIAVHIGVAGTPLRDSLRAGLGARGYAVLFSVASLAGLWWLVSSYTQAEYVPLWGQPEWWKLVADVLFDEYKEPLYASPPLLTRLVEAGRLGRKTGAGFYEYG